MSYDVLEEPSGRSLVLRGPWSDQAVGEFSTGNVSGLVLNYARGYPYRDIEIPDGVRPNRLDVIVRTAKDLLPIYRIGESLTSLSIQIAAQPEIDIGRMPHLRYLSASWKQVETSIHNATLLERVAILAYSAQNLEPLASLPALTHVQMKHYPHLSTLAGLEKLHELATLDIFTARRLDDISVLAGDAAPDLKRLSLGSCRKIDSLVSLTKRTRLEWLDVSEGATLDSARPLAGLAGLSTLCLYGSTRIADGDLAPIASLPNLREFLMMNRKDYRPSVKEIQERIAGTVASTSSKMAGGLSTST